MRHQNIKSPAVSRPRGRWWFWTCLFLLLAGCAAEEQLGSGADLYQRLNCWACHDRRQETSSWAPDLTAIGHRLSPAELEQQLLTPRRRHPESRMPSYAFVRPRELQALLVYLSRER